MVSAALKEEEEEVEGPVAIDNREVQRSGEHAIELDGLVRRAFERAFEADLQATSEMCRFALEDVLANPVVRPTEPPQASPIVGLPIMNVVEAGNAAMEIGPLPPPAIEIDRTKLTKKEERDP